MKVLLATNNEAKILRFKKLLKHTDLDIELVTPNELGIDAIDVAENAPTLAGNAELKARAYADKVNIPILSNDTGFYVQGEGFVDAPKRRALGEGAEQLSKEEAAEKMLNFWKDVATKHGGRVDAAWIEAFIVLYPDGTMKKADSKREVILTDQILGEVHQQMPVRALYYSKATNKPAAQHTEEEKFIELQPVIEALRTVLTN